MGVKLSDRNITLKKQSIHPMTSFCRYFNSMKSTKLIDFKIVTMWSMTNKIDRKIKPIEEYIANVVDINRLIESYTSI
jgi:hypothetical protein